MQIWYTIINTLFPFEWAKYDFMKNALLAIIIITPLLGMLGTMIVNNRMSFFSDALGHSALTGIALGVIFGLDSPLISMLAFSILFTFAIIYVKNKNTLPTDTIISVFSSTAVALGIVILSKSGGFNKYSKYLIGDLLSITTTDIEKLLIAFVVILVFWILLFNKLMLLSLNSSLASSRGLNVIVIETLFSLIIALIVTISIQWVGLLIINSLLILPAAASRNISKNMKQYTIYSIIFAITSGIIGLFLSYFAGTATGSTIVLVLAGVFFITLFLKVKIS